MAHQAMSQPGYAGQAHCWYHTTCSGCKNDSPGTTQARLAHKVCQPPPITHGTVPILGIVAHVCTVISVDVECSLLSPAGGTLHYIIPSTQSVGTL